MVEVLMFSQSDAASDHQKSFQISYFLLIRGLGVAKFPVHAAPDL